MRKTAAILLLLTVALIAIPSVNAWPFNNTKDTPDTAQRAPTFGRGSFDFARLIIAILIVFGAIYAALLIITNMKED